MDAAGSSQLEEIHLDLDDEFRNRIKAECEPGERLIWAGRPVGRASPIQLAPIGWGIVAFACLAVSVWSIWRWNRFGGSGDTSYVPLAVFPTAFAIMIILSILSNRHLRLTAETAGYRELYALTDRRLIVWKPYRLPTGTAHSPRRGSIVVQSRHRGSVYNVQRVEHPDGTGDVLLSSGDEIVNITDARRVERLVRESLVVKLDAEPNPG